MIRFFVFVAIILVFGLSTLSKYSPGYVEWFAFSIFGVILLATIIKIALDFFLYYKEEESEESNDKVILGEKKSKTYYDISEYSQAIRKRDSKN